MWIKIWLYDRKFNRAVERYYRERLEPELAWVGERRCLKATRRRHVGLVDTCYGPGVVKIYYRRTGRLKNALRAIELLDEIGLDFAKVWAVDQDPESMSRYRIASVVQEYIDGEDFDADRDRERLPSMARILARMHGCLNDQCGDLRGPFSNHFWRDRFRPMLRRKLDPLCQGPYCEAWPWAHTIQAWFEGWGDRPGKHIGGWSFIHGDWTPHNVKISPEGRIVFLDLDLCKYSLHGIEAIRGPVRFAISCDELDEIESLDEFWVGFASRIDPFIEAYLNDLPASFGEDWFEHRNFYLS